MLHWAASPSAFSVKPSPSLIPPDFTPKPPLSVTVIDDEVQIRRMLKRLLDSLGYSVREAETGKAGLDDIIAHPPDTVILDLNLPDMTGFAVLEKLRTWSQVPVLVLSVLSAESEKVMALDLGADDFLSKPFGSRELQARLRAITRRHQPLLEPSAVRVGDIEFNAATRRVTRGSEVIKLTVKEFALLQLLVAHRGRVVTHQQILRAIWGPKAESNTHYLRVHMAHLRQKLEPVPSRPQYLLTEPGVGFRLVGGDEI